MSTNETSTISTKPTDSPVTLESEELRFSQGLLFRGKFFGVEDVKKETGDEVCQDSMVKIRAVLAAKKESKQRICIKINLEGIELVDEKTNTSLYKHSVNRISYIARDVKDSKAIGYIYKTTENSFQYFGLRTIDQAQVVFNTLKELFEVVLKIRNSKKNTAEPAAVASQPAPIPKAQVDDSEKKAENSLIDSNDKSSLISKEPDVAASQNSTNLFDIGVGSVPKETTSSPKADDLFGLLSLSAPVSTTTASPVTNPLFDPSSSSNIAGLNPLASLNANNLQSRPAPIPPMTGNNIFGMNPIANPMMANPMLTNPMGSQPSFMQQQQQQQQQQQFYQQPNQFQANAGFQNQQMNNPQMSNPFGNAFGTGNQFQAPRPMAPMNTQMSPPQNAQQNNFNDLFSGSQFPNQSGTNASKPNASPFNW